MKKSLRIILMLIAAALLLTAIAWLLGLPGFLTVRLTPAQTLFQTATDRFSRSIADAVSERYDTLLFEEREPKRVQLDVSLTLQPESAQKASETTGIPADALSDISLSWISDYREEGYMSQAQLSVENEPFLTVQVLADRLTGRQWLTLPDLTEHYLESEPTQMPQQYMSAQLMQILPQSRQLQDIIQKYMSIYTNSFSQVRKEMVILEAEELTCKATAVTGELTQTQLLEAHIACLEALREDPIVRQFLQQYTKLYIRDLSTRLPEAAEADLYAEFIGSVDSATEQCMQALQKAGDTQAVQLTLYFGRTGRLLGFAAQSGEFPPLQLLLLTKGRSFSVKYQYGDSKLGISGVYRRGKVSFSGKLSQPEKADLFLSATDLSIRSRQTGQIRFIREEGMLILFLQERGFGVEAFRSDNPLGRLEVSRTVTQSQLPAFPMEALNASDAGQVEQWFASLDQKLLRERLARIGLTEERLNALFS